jgi:hypothetical protein
MKLNTGLIWLSGLLSLLFAVAAAIAMARDMAILDRLVAGDSVDWLLRSQRSHIFRRRPLRGCKRWRMKSAPSISKQPEPDDDDAETALVFPCCCQLVPSLAAAVAGEEEAKSESARLAYDSERAQNN